MKRLRQSIVISLITFVAFFTSIGLLLKAELFWENILAMVIYSLLIGLLFYGFAYFKLKITYTLFLLGHFLGLVMMGYAYWSEVSGWEEIIGFLSYMIFLIGGLGLGVVLQIVISLYRKYKKEN